MGVIINGQDPDFSVSGKTLEEIRQEVGLWAFNQGHALWEFRYNGDIVQPEDVARPPGDDGVIEIKTRSFAEVLAELQTEVAVFLPRLTEALSTAADQIYEGRESDGVLLFQDCLDGLEWTFQAWRLARTMTAGFGAYCSSDRLPAEQLLTKAESALLDIEQALADGDVTMLADLLQSSLCPVMNEWLEEVA